MSGGYVSIGLAAAICAILIKAETDNVIVARAKAGLPVPGSASSANGAGGAGLSRTARCLSRTARCLSRTARCLSRTAGASHATRRLNLRTLALRGRGELASALRLHRIIQAVELSLLVVVAAVIDAVRGGLGATRVLVVACLVVGAAMVAAHLIAILASRRLG